MYPDTIPAFQAVLLVYEPAEDHADAIYYAQAQGSVVLQAVSVFSALKSAPDLTHSGLALLLGAAFLITSGGWHGLSGEAATLLAARASELQPTE